MKPAARKQLNRAMWLERLSPIKIALIFSGFVACAGVSTAYLYPAETNNIRATTVSFTARSKHIGAAPRTMIRLEGGREVYATFPDWIGFREDETVDVVETKSFIGRPGNRVCKVIA